MKYMGKLESVYTYKKNEKQKIPHCRNSSKTQYQNHRTKMKNKHTTLSEQFQNTISKS